MNPNPFDKAEKVIELKDVTFAYEGETVMAGVNIDIHRREFASVVGPNGSGKSTLIKLILGLLKPLSGSVRVFGQPPEKVRQRIGYAPQHAQVDPQFPATLLDVVLMGLLRPDKGIFGRHTREDREAAIAALEMVDLADRMAQPFSALSGGQRQRALIARALASNPEILIFDEPTANLDANAEFKLYDLMQELNRERTIILVSHDLGFVSQIVHTVICVRYNVQVHPTSELTGDMITELYGGDIRMVRHDHRCTEEGHNVALHK